MPNSNFVERSGEIKPACNGVNLPAYGGYASGEAVRDAELREEHGDSMPDVQLSDSAAEAEPTVAAVPSETASQRSLFDKPFNPAESIARAKEMLGINPDEPAKPAPSPDETITRVFDQRRRQQTGR